MMPQFDAKEFYNLSIKIADAYANQAGYRTAIGRAYYACHLVGVNSTVNKGWFKPTHSAGDHSGLSNALKDKKNFGLADKLSELYRLREHADYHIQNRPEGECNYCDCVKSGNDLVDIKTWRTAFAIAENLLPKLENINPKKPD